MSTTAERLSRTSFLDTLLNRRSRRFGLGMKMPAGPLAFTSQHPAHPLSEDEEAALAFAGAGITGPALADLSHAQGQGANIMNGFVGRTVGSGDGIQTVALFVINDRGAWLVKRPRELAASELSELIQMAGERNLTAAYHRSRVRVKSQRVAPPVEPIFNINLNRWSLHATGTSYFLPVNDMTFLYINALLEIFNEDTRVYVLDERASFRPAGLEQFARSRGGHLEDDPRKGRVVTIQLIERMVTQFVTIEQGMMLQNIALMAQALGLGGFPNFASHEYAWFQALGFRMREMPASRYLGAGPVVSFAMNLLKRNVGVPFPVGLEHEGRTLLKSYCPPYFPGMKEAVEAVVKEKHSAFENTSNKTWLNAPRIPHISEKAIHATVAYCDYIGSRYGRFPAYLAPFGTVVGFQACHLDAGFYDTFYKPEALSREQREDFARCTGSKT